MSQPDTAPLVPVAGEAVSRFIDADGVQTHYLECGIGPPLVLVHGGGPGADARGNWSACLPLYARKHHVFAVDLVGFGRSAKPDPAAYDYGQVKRNRHLADFIAQLGVGPVHLIGNSMGGATALGVAMERPELVRKLVLMGSAGLAISNPDPQHIKSLAAYDFTLEGMRRTMRALTGAGYVVDEALAQYRYELTLAADARSSIEAIRSSKLTYERDEIARVRTPTLVVGGKEDKIAVLARTYGYLELLPNSWGFILPHCGHWVMLEAPEEFFAVTTAFLSDELFRVRA